MKKADKDVATSIEKLIAKRIGKIVGEILGLIIGIVILFAVLPKLPFVTAEYSIWLPIAVIAMILSFGFNVIKHILFKPFSYAFEILNLIPSIYSTYRLYEIYPFDFTSVGYPNIDQLFPSLLLLALTIMVIAIIVNIIRVFLFPVELLSKLGAKKGK